MILNKKTVARLGAIQALYLYDQQGLVQEDAESVVKTIFDLYLEPEFIAELFQENAASISKVKPSPNHLKNLVQVTINNIDNIDAILQKYLIVGWTLEKCSPALLAIMRVAICELKFFTSIPSNVVLNEFTDIAAEILDQYEVSFVNSVLDNIKAEIGH